ncbi:MAG TPA: SMC-Scp complex subunit ScpB [Solirubrobacteraceae bacterium]
MSTAELERTVESLLFLSSEPVPAPALADATGAELHDVVTALERLREHYEYERRGFVVRELAGGYTLTSHPDTEPAARRLLAKPRTPPLTAAQAETLAIVAYLQPVSRPEIARIRGVSAESAATTLLERGIIEEAGRSQFGAVLYRTTELFLKLFGLTQLSELPDIAGFDPSPEFEQELRERLLRAGEARAGLAGVATPPVEGGVVDDGALEEGAAGTDEAVPAAGSDEDAPAASAGEDAPAANPTG